MDCRVAAALAARLGGPWHVRTLGASGFTATGRADGAGGPLFVKTLPAAEADTLAAEADGLQALAATATLRVPAVAGCWIDDGLALLALEWLELRASADGARLGAALGALHAAAPAEGDGRFGWRRNNRLGSTVQRNAWSSAGGLDGWIEFFGQRRLMAMHQALATAGAPAALGHAVEAVVAALPRFFDDGHLPRASLIHGDLWSGNHGALADGTPVVYDPAVSVSDAEAELAMLELFGSPPPGFWPAYRATAGLAQGYERRRPLYQLYHLLNHALLFGGGYVAQSLAVAERLQRA
ncbi:fructosamine kinase family protein [Rubrivivax gelatinosus]|uniref:Fructosamine-3-kinase n=1 Tax=Rubrivivax gelatinosus TaxID=28068 RepID=A0A4R2MIU5_RUBGE|nr:fructosamine kinase family protein [Rubrivivax gelatinosus]MBK1688660.1 transferase [Rubrivivax gelatinosus]TCP04624.1 fructosamine-3-kinase [Rubrivivax gelatinosus]